MTEQEQILIEKYLDGQLTEAEKAAVRSRRAADEAFENELAARQAMQNWLRADALRQKTKAATDSFGAEFFGAQAAAASEKAGLPAEVSTKEGIQNPQSAIFNVVHRARFLYAMAASLALLIGAFWLLNRPQAIDYQRFAMHETLSLTVRSGASDGAQAELFFNQKNYAAALTELQKLAAKTPDDLQIRLFEAICLIENDRSKEARVILEPIEKGASAWAGEARWYLALSFLKEKNVADCRAVLTKIKAGEAHFSAAQTILETK